MPNRILRDSICRSDSIDGLTWFEEVLFYRLLVNVDDYGRFDGRPAVIRGMCFPLKDVRLDQIKNALNSLTSACMIYTYKVEAKSYIQIVHWEQYQQIRSKKSKYPAPDATCNQMISDDIKCNQMISDVTVIQSNTIQSESNPNPNPNPNPIYRAKCTDTDVIDLQESWFNTFWNTYPKHSDKKKAHDKFIKICKTQDVFNSIMNGLNVTVVPKAKAEGTQFIPLATTWLNGERWNDEPYVPKQQHGYTRHVIEATDYSDPKYHQQVTITPEELKAIKQKQEEMG